MSDPKTQQEPTMEEILASIRRIISEDDKAAPAAGEDAPATAAPAAVAEEVAPPPPPPPPMPKPSAKPAVAAAPPPPPPPMPKAQPAVAAAPAMRAVEPEPAPAADAGEPAEFDDSVLELTEIIEEGAEAPSAPPPTVERPKPRIVSPAPVALEPEPEPVMTPVRAPATAAAAAPAMRAGATDLSQLVSDATAMAAATSFAGFANQVQQTKGVTLEGSERTLEELVKDLLRPMLKDWLDRNLPPLVQRLVELEIAKLAGRSEEEK